MTAEKGMLFLLLLVLRAFEYVLEEIELGCGDARKEHETRGEKCDGSKDHFCWLLVLRRVWGGITTAKVFLIVDNRLGLRSSCSAMALFRHQVSCWASTICLFCHHHRLGGWMNLKKLEKLEFGKRSSNLSEQRNLSFECQICNQKRRRIGQLAASSIWR